jgi:TolB-like protein/Tfp pilus assembly protein PilF
MRSRTRCDAPSANLAAIPLFSTLMSEPAGAVFLSYASEDAEAARRVCEALREAGIEVWFDQSELRGGDAWDASIRKKIKECALFVPFVSAHSDARSEGYFRLEWKLAVDRSHLMADDQAFLLPVVIDQTLEPTARVPDRFRERQWSRLSDDKSIAKFVQRVRNMLSENSAADTVRDVHPTSGGVSRIALTGAGTARRIWLIAAASVAAGVLLIAVVGNWQLRPASKQVESIAVMPFVNASGSEDLEYLSDGMTETLIGSLSQLPMLNVKARSVVFNYKGKDATPASIGKELKVQALLNGRLAQHGPDLSLYVELFDVEQDKVLWSEQYRRSQTDLISLQTEIARDVLAKLRAKLSGAETLKLAQVSTANPDAYRAYLRGNYYTNKITREGFQKGVEYYNQAIALDPNYALAYSGLAYNYISTEDWFIAPKEAAPKARAAAQKALALQAETSEAHVALGIIAHWYDWDWANAEREFKRASELDRNDPLPYAFNSWLLASIKRNDEAIAAAKRAQQIDPVSGLVTTVVGSVLMWSHQPDQALEQLKIARELDPSFWYTPYFIGLTYVQKGMYAEALPEFRRALELEPDNAENLANLGFALGALNRKAEARQILDELKKQSAGRYVAPYNIAVIHLGLGDKDEAFAWLERAYTDRSSFMAIHLTADPRLDSLRGDPRLKDLIRRVGLPQ